MAEFRRYSTYLGLIISVYMVKWAFSRWDVCRLLTILEQYEQFYLHRRVYDILQGVNYPRPEIHSFQFHELSGKRNPDCGVHNWHR